MEVVHIVLQELIDKWCEKMFRQWNVHLPKLWLPIASSLRFFHGNFKFWIFPFFVHTLIFQDEIFKLRFLFGGQEPFQFHFHFHFPNITTLTEGMEFSRFISEVISTFKHCWSVHTCSFLTVGSTFVKQIKFHTNIRKNQNKICKWNIA